MDAPAKDLKTGVVTESAHGKFYAWDCKCGRRNSVPVDPKTQAEAVCMCGEKRKVG